MSHLNLARVAVFLFTALLFSGCASWRENGLSSKKPDNFYGYFPIDPLEVIPPEENDKGTNSSFWLKSLQDETTRLAVGRVTADGQIVYGPLALGGAGTNYSVVVDYVKYTTKSALFVTNTPSDSATPQDGRSFKFHGWVGAPDFEAPKGSSVTIPVYVGVGVRLTASLYVRSGKVALTDLTSLGIGARSEKLAGSMVTQSLGLTGKEISTVAPLPTAINETSIQNAVISIATMRSKLYDDGVYKWPRIVGFYNQGFRPNQVNDIITGLAANPLKLDPKSGLLSSSVPTRFQTTVGLTNGQSLTLESGFQLIKADLDFIRELNAGGLSQEEIQRFLSYPDDFRTLRLSTDLSNPQRKADLARNILADRPTRKFGKG